MSTLLPENVPELFAAVVTATKRYEDAKAEEDAARRTATALLNELNGAQKELDRAVAQLKDAAPTFTEWKARAQ